MQPQSIHIMIHEMLYDTENDASTHWIHEKGFKILSIVQYGTARPSDFIIFQMSFVKITN